MSALGALVVSLALENAQFTKGLDKSSQEALKFAKNTQDSFDKASKATKDYFQGGVKDVVAMGAAYLSVSSIISSLKSSINDLGALDDMAQKTGSSVENLSRLQKVATQFGGDFEAVNVALNKLSKGLAGIDDAGGKTAKALDAIGISQQFVKSHDPSEIMVEVAKRLQGYEDGASKAALATDLFGKSGIELLPYLNDLAENVDKFTGSSAEAAAKAAALQDRLGGFKVKVDEASTSIVTTMLPALDEITTNFIENAKHGNLFLATLAAIGNTVAIAFFGTDIANAEKRQLELIDQIANKEKALKEVSSSSNKQSMENARRSIVDAKIELANVTKQLDDAYAKDHGNASQNNDKQKSDYQGAEAKAAIQAKLDAARKASAAILKQQEDQYEAVIEKVTQYTAAQSLDAAQTEKVTPGQKIALEILVQVRDGKLKLNEAQKAVLATDLKAMLLQEKSTAAENLRIESQKKFTEGLIEARQAVDAMIETQQSALDKTTEQIQLMLIGKNGIDDLEIARLNETAAAYEQNIAYAKLNGVSQENINYLEKQAEAFRTLADIKKKSSEADANLESLNLGKKRADDAIAESKRVADKILQDQQDMNRSINSSLTDALLRGFESGKGFAKNFKDTLVNMFKTLVLQPVISYIVSPISGAITAALGGLLGNGTAQAAAAPLGSASGSGSGDFMSSASNIFTMIKGGNASIVGGIESLGASIANGMGGIRDTIGGFMGANASGIANAFSYGGAILQLAQGNWAGAAGTAIGTALGGPIGGAIGSMLGGVVGGLFGSSHQIPSTGAGATGTYSNGIYLPTGTNQAGASGAGDSTGVAAINKMFAQQLGSYLTSFGVNNEISSMTAFAANARKNFSSVSGEINGQKFSNYSESRTYEQFIDDVFGKITVDAIQKSSLPASIRNLFNGLADKTQVANMLNATRSLNSSQKELASRFGMTVEQSAQVSNATGLVGDSLASFVSTLSTLAISFKTPAQQLIEVRDALSKNFGIGNLPKTLDAFDAKIKSIDKSTDAGIKRVAQLLSIRAGFQSYTGSLDSIKSNVSGATFGLRSPEAQVKLMQDELSKMFGDLKLTVPDSIEALLKFGDSINYTTEAGLNLALAFPNLVDAFTKTQSAADALIAKSKASADELIAKSKASADALFNQLVNGNAFTSLAESRAYKGISNNYGGEFAADYIANSRTGAISVNSQGKAVRTSDNNTELVALLKELRDLSKQNLIQSKDSTNTLQRMDRVGIPVRA